MLDDWFADYEDLLFERRDAGVLLITINRPEHYNATTASLHSALSRVWYSVEHDDDVRVVVITGAGKAFSAGGDNEWVQSMLGDYEGMRLALREASDLVNGMLGCSKVIISAINGSAVGTGLAVALLADISVASETARFADGHTRLGVAAGDHANVIWPLLCGIARSKYYLLTSRFLDGKTAADIGLVSLAVPSEHVVPEALKIADELAQGAQDAIRLTKRAVNLWIKSALPEFEASLAYEMLGFMSPDAAEGLAAIVEKRTPRYPSSLPVESNGNR